MYGRVKNAKNIILTLEKFAANAIEINTYAIKMSRQKIKKSRNNITGNVISATKPINTLRICNVMGVKNSHNQRQKFLKFKLKIDQTSKWNQK